MEQIGQGGCVIVIISDKYLRSENCMFELIEVAENKDFRERVLPVILSDANIYDSVKLIEYIKYWENKKGELEKTVKSLDLANLDGIYEKINLYDRIRDEFSRLVNILGDMNALTPEIHQDTNFNDLYAAVLNRLSANPTGRPVQSGPSVQSGYREDTRKTQQEEKGSGPIFSGRFHGPVNFDNRQINAEQYIEGGENNRIIVDKSINDIDKVFELLKKQVEKLPAGDERKDAHIAIAELEKEAQKKDQAEESRVKKWMLFLADTAPDALEIAVSTFINPVQGLSAVFKKVAEKIKEERGK
jgi:hypothetical protein